MLLMNISKIWLVWKYSFLCLEFCYSFPSIYVFPEISFASLHKQWTRYLFTFNSFLYPIIIIIIIIIITTTIIIDILWMRHAQPVDHKVCVGRLHDLPKIIFFLLSSHQSKIVTNKCIQLYCAIKVLAVIQGMQTYIVYMKYTQCNCLTHAYFAALWCCGFSQEIVLHRKKKRIKAKFWQTQLAHRVGMYDTFAELLLVLPLQYGRLAWFPYFVLNSVQAWWVGKSFSAFRLDVTTAANPKTALRLISKLTAYWSYVFGLNWSFLKI